MIKMLVVAGGTGAVIGWMIADPDAAVIVGSAATIGLVIALASIILRSLHVSDVEETSGPPSVGALL